MIQVDLRAVVVDIGYEGGVVGGEAELRFLAGHVERLSHPRHDAVGRPVVVGAELHRHFAQVYGQRIVVVLHLALFVERRVKGKIAARARHFHAFHVAGGQRTQFYRLLAYLALQTDFRGSEHGVAVVADAPGQAARGSHGDDELAVGRCHLQVLRQCGGCDSEKCQNSKNTILHNMVGLVVCSVHTKVLKNLQNQAPHPLYFSLSSSFSPLLPGGVVQVLKVVHQPALVDEVSQPQFV